MLTHSLAQTTVAHTQKKNKSWLALSHSQHNTHTTQAHTYAAASFTKQTNTYIDWRCQMQCRWQLEWHHRQTLQQAVTDSPTQTREAKPSRVRNAPIRSTAARLLPPLASPTTVIVAAGCSTSTDIHRNRVSLK